MPAQKGIQADAKAINRLIEESGMLIKQIVEPSRLKTLQRARNGERLNDESMHYLAQVFGVDVADISIGDNKPKTFQRYASMKFLRTDSLKGFPKGVFELRDFGDMDLLEPITVEARFEVDDPTDEQAETAAQLVEAVEALASPQEPSTMIRAKGKLNSTIKQLAEMGIYLYVGTYKHRESALPFVDADQTEVALPVIRNRLLLIFTESRKSRAIQRRVDLGMSMEDLDQSVEWLSNMLKEFRAGKLDEESVLYLDRLRKEAKAVFVDLSI